MAVEIFHSNIEGEVINKFYDGDDAGTDAAIHQSGRPIPRAISALMAAISQVRFPTIELHISNPARARPGLGDGSRQPGRRDRVRHFRLLSGLARPAGDAGRPLRLRDARQGRAGLHPGRRRPPSRRGADDRCTDAFSPTFESECAATETGLASTMMAHRQFGIARTADMKYDSPSMGCWPVCC
jgi:hypothetical protein